MIMRDKSKAANIHSEEHLHHIIGDDMRII